MTFDPAQPSLPLIYLRVLYLLLCRIRCKGLMSIEADIDQPESSKLFLAFPELQRQPEYFAFLCDMLGVIVGGVALDPEQATRYAAAAERTLARAGQVDTVTFDVIRATLLAAIQGAAPQVAIEFGRQAIPFGARPTFDELDAWIREARFALAAQPDRPPLAERINAFFTRIRS